MPRYLPDSNCFIQSHGQYYPLDVAHSFWSKMAQLAASGQIESIDKVQKEVYHYQGDLKIWIQQNIQPSFFKSSANCIVEYGHLVRWAQSRNNHYLPQAINDFMDVERADAWLIAHAKYCHLTVVTYETSEPKKVKAIKIPDACRAVSVPCINLITMFRQLGETW